MLCVLSFQLPAVDVRRTCYDVTLLHSEKYDTIESDSATHVLELRESETFVHSTMVQWEA